MSQKPPSEIKAAEELYESIEDPIDTIGGNVGDTLSQIGSQIGEVFSSKIVAIEENIESSIQSKNTEIKVPPPSLSAPHNKIK